MLRTTQHLDSFEELPLWFEMDGKIYGTLLLKGRTPPYSLNFMIGDPDSNEAVVFVKE